MWTNAEVVRVRVKDVRRKRLLFFLVCQVTAQSWEGLCSDCYYVLMKMIWDDSKTTGGETFANRCWLLSHRGKQR